MATPQHVFSICLNSHFDHNKHKMWKQLNAVNYEHKSVELDSDHLADDFEKLFGEPNENLITELERQADIENEIYATECLDAPQVEINPEVIVELTKNLKNGRSPGETNIENECIKYDKCLFFVLYIFIYL